MSRQDQYAAHNVLAAICAERDAFRAERDEARAKVAAVEAATELLRGLADRPASIAADSPAFVARLAVELLDAALAAVPSVAGVAS